jgi:hypothetical protein
MNSMKNLRRRLTVSATALALAAASFFVVQAVYPGSVRSGGDGADHGPPASARTLADRLDPATGVTFRLVTYASAYGTCYDVLATAPDGNPLGGPGGCGAVSPAKTGAGVLVGGALAVPAPGGSERWMRIAAGVSSCDCLVDVGWGDGRSLATRARSGYFIGVLADGAPPRGDAKTEVEVAQVRVSR